MNNDLIRSGKTLRDTFLNVKYHILAKYLFGAIYFTLNDIV
jgi:hypothetical protein